MKLKKILSLSLILLSLFSLISCGMSSKMPDDFAFSIVWDVNGISSYNSTTGKLVKTTDATNPENYVTELFLTDTQLAAVYEALREINIYSYPEVYDPSPNLRSSPSQNIILSVSGGGKSTKITCEEILIYFESEDAKGQKFFTACKTIIDILTESDAWQALPEYEFYYY